MKGFSQFWSLACDEGHCHGQIIFAHGGLEIGERLVMGFGMACAPVHEQADDQATEHPQDPQSLGAANPAAVLIEGDVQALVSAVFDAPSQAVGFEPALCGKLLWGQVGDEAHRFVFASGVLAG